MNSTVPLSALVVGDDFTLDGAEYRIKWVWSTGVEAWQVASWGRTEKRVLRATTVVERA